MLICRADGEACYYTTRKSISKRHLQSHTQSLVHVKALRLMHAVSKRLHRNLGRASLPSTVCSMSRRRREHIGSGQHKERRARRLHGHLPTKPMFSHCPRGGHVSVSRRCVELLHVDLRQEEDQAHPRLRMLAVGLRHARSGKLMEQQVARACS